MWDFEASQTVEVRQSKVDALAQVKQFQQNKITLIHNKNVSAAIVLKVKKFQKHKTGQNIVYLGRCVNVVNLFLGSQCHLNP